MPGTPATPTRPLASTVMVLMLAFSLSITALLAYLGGAAPATPTQDRYVTSKANTPDPFRLPGCILQGQTPLNALDQPCKTSRPSQLWPQHAEPLLNDVLIYTQARRGHSPNMLALPAAPSQPPALATPIIQGRHVHLALQDKVQSPAQTTAECYTGNAAACQRCTWCHTDKAAEMFEGARARSLGLLVINAHSGAIEAAASAYTACHAQQQRGKPGPGCPQLPNTLQPHPERLGNQTFEPAAKPGSITKIIIALALYEDGLSPLEAAKMPLILTQSLTPELIDIVMCKAQSFDAACAQRRLAAIAAMAGKLGWNKAGVDVLGSGQLPGLQAQRFGARLLSGMTSPQRSSLTQAGLTACAAQRWQACQGEHLVNIVAELFGTGEALASPLGVGNALLHLAAGANRQAEVPLAHLIDAAQDDAGQTQSVVPGLAPAVNQAVAQAVLKGLSASTTEGTAKTACLAAASALPGGRLPCAPGKNGPNLFIAGKTGTPIFSADISKKVSLPLDQWRAQCERYREQLAQFPASQPGHYRLKNERLKCNMVPTKYFAMLLREPGSQQWDKIVVALAERNWNQRTGLIDSPNDTGANVAAEASLALVNALYHPSQPAQIQP